MRTRWMIVPLALALAPRAGAVDVANGKLTVSGFGEWAYGRTSNENVYLVGEEDGKYENAQFALQVTARPQDELVVAGQLFVAADGEVGLDWAFAEYRVRDELRVRVGKVKNPFGLFMEVKDVGTLRPFFTLPQSVYGPTDFSAEAYLGAGLTGEWQGESSWGVAYDAYVGALEVPSFEPGMAVENAPGGVPPYAFADFPEHDALATDVVGGRIALLTPVDGLTLRLTGFTGTFAQPGEEAERINCYGVSAEYAVERFQVRVEGFQATEGDSETHTGAYGEVAWNFLPRLQIALRWEESYQSVGDGGGGLPEQFTEHQEAALGLSYWPSPNLVLKASFHRVDGNRFAVPTESAPDGSVERRTDLLVAGAQFSF